MSEAGAATVGLQLRILSGMHAGARATLEGDEYVLGASEECDFVLMDALVQPRHAMLSRRDDCWQVDWVADEGEETVFAPMRLEPGMAVPLGPIVIAVDAPDAPWPTLEQLVLVPHAPALEPHLPPPAEHEAEAARHGGDSFGGIFARGVKFTGVAATACLSAVAMVASPMILQRDSARLAIHPPAQPAAVAASSAASAPDTTQRSAIETVLKELGFASRAHVESSELGWVVHAGVVTEGESETLRTALARLKPRPMLRATAEEDLRDLLTDALNRLGAEYRGKLSYRYIGEGKVRVEGRIAPGTDVEKLSRTLAASFPQVGAWESAVDAGGQAAADLLAQLRGLGWQVVGDWDGARLLMHVTLQQRDVPKWEQALLAVARNSTVPFSASLAFAQTAAPVAPVRYVPEGRPPFEIRSVVGGDSPYLLLQDGEKLAPGGVLQGWKLSAIAANQIVFESGARRAVVPR